MKPKNSIVDLFDYAKKNQTYVKVCAPMVRYSKVQFRTLVKNFGVDLTFTPMILADSFCQNARARLNEFSTTWNDSPVIVQFAANNVNDFIDASNLVHPYADGIDLNCGCPQRWAMKDGYGCALLFKPERMYELVRSVRRNLPVSFSVSVKIRILDELNKTLAMCQNLESCGVTFLTVHGRTPSQKSKDEIDISAIKSVVEAVKVPIIANGGIKTLKDADRLHNTTNCIGVMAASGILTNPALFDGANITPHNCVRLWMYMKNKHQNKITFQCYHHHLVFMLEKVLTRKQKQIFNHLCTFESVDEFLIKNLLNSYDSELNIQYNLSDFIVCEYSDEIVLRHSIKCRGCNKSKYYCICSKYDCDVNNGSYFTSYVQNYDDLHYMGNNLFEET